MPTENPPNDITRPELNLQLKVSPGEERQDLGDLVWMGCRLDGQTHWKSFERQHIVPEKTCQSMELSARWMKVLSARNQTVEATGLH
jgi:hypothetical protein